MSDAPIYHEGVIHSRFINPYTDRETMHISALPRKRIAWGAPLLNAKGEIMGMVSYVTDNDDFTAELMAPPADWEKSGLTIMALNYHKVIPLFCSPAAEHNLTYCSIELTPDATYVHAAYTHTMLCYHERFMLWNEKDQKEFGFYIKDTNTDRMFFLTESTLGTRENGTKVAPCETHYFTMTFPPLPSDVQQIALIEGSFQEWSLPEVDLRLNDPVTIRATADKANELTHYLQKLRGGASTYYTRKLRETMATYPAKSEVAINGQAYALLVNNEEIGAIISLLEKYTQTGNATDLTWLNLHALYLWAGNDQQALVAITEAINRTQGPRLKEWYIRRAVMYMQDPADYDAAYNDWTAADKIFYSGASLLPWEFTAYRIMCAYEGGKMDLAKQHYRELKEQLPELGGQIGFDDNARSEDLRQLIDYYAEKLGEK